MRSYRHFRRLATLIFFLVGTLSTALAQNQVGGGLGISSDELDVLRQLPPDQREALLRSLAESSQVTSNEALAFPELVRPLNGTGLQEGTDPNQLFDALGNPILDSERRPVILTDELLRELEFQSPQDWLEDGRPFLEQEIILRPFGYDLFKGAPTTFAPATDIPVPPEYRLGPGDTIDVQLFGKQNRQYSLVVNRDGTINFPNIGPINVMGESFQDLKQAILDRVSEQLIGTSAAVNMGALRSIRVLVLGDSQQPGSYTVSGLSTITNALFVSGGIKEIGSLRNVQLKRSGKVVARLDLYDLLLKGESSDDVRLESGDVIFIPTVGKTVAVGGFVNRPAIYELRNERTVEDVIKLAGGLRPDAYPQGARVERFDADQERSFIDLNLRSPEGLQSSVAAGDTLLIPPVLDVLGDGVRLFGHVQRPGEYEWSPGMRLTDLLPSLSLLQPQADIQYVLIRRQTSPDQRVQVLSASLAAALINPASEENPVLNAQDRVYVFSLEDPTRQVAADESDTDELDQPSEVEASTSSRAFVVGFLLAELRRQAGADMPFERVSVAGEVRVPGEYPYEAGMRISDLIRAAGGLTEAALRESAELTRYSVTDGRTRTSQVIDVSLGEALDGAISEDKALGPSDFLTIRRLEDWQNEFTVVLGGEVRYPGTYAIRQGDTLASVLQRAGGLTDQAFPAGSVFLREELRVREQQQLDRLRDRLQGDLAQLSLRVAGQVNGSTNVFEAQSAGQALLEDLSNVEAVGRLVIDLPGMIERPDDSLRQLILKDGDQLLVPSLTQEVTIIGEVFFPTSHLFDRKLSLKEYLRRSGGITPAGSRKNIYVVRANGAVIASNSGLFRRSQSIQPGDTIVVPLDTDRGFRLQAVASATTILYNIAIAVAAINGLSD